MFWMVLFPFPLVLLDPPPLLFLTKYELEFSLLLYSYCCYFSRINLLILLVKLSWAGFSYTERFDDIFVVVLSFLPSTTFFLKRYGLSLIKMDSSFLSESIFGLLFTFPIEFGVFMALFYCYYLLRKYPNILFSFCVFNFTRILFFSLSMLLQ